MAEVDRNDSSSVRYIKETYKQKSVHFEGDGDIRTRKRGFDPDHAEGEWGVLSGDNTEGTGGPFNNLYDYYRAKTTYGPRFMMQLVLSGFAQQALITGLAVGLLGAALITTGFDPVTNIVHRFVTVALLVALGITVPAIWKKESTQEDFGGLLVDAVSGRFGKGWINGLVGFTLAAIGRVCGAFAGAGVARKILHHVDAAAWNGLTGNTAVFGTSAGRYGEFFGFAWGVEFFLGIALFGYALENVFTYCYLQNTFGYGLGPDTIEVKYRNNLLRSQNIWQFPVLQGVIAFIGFGGGVAMLAYPMTFIGLDMVFPGQPSSSERVLFILGTLTRAGVALGLLSIYRFAVATAMPVFKIGLKAGPRVKEFRKAYKPTSHRVRR